MSLNTGSLGASSDTNGSHPDGVAFRLSAAPSGSSLSVSGNVTGAILAGDKLLLINLQGAAADNADTGKCENPHRRGDALGHDHPARVGRRE